MASLHVSLSDEMRRYVDDQIAGGSYHNHSEYVRDLIRHDQARKQRERIDALLLEGLTSGSPQEMSSDDWRHVQERVRARAGETRG